MTTTKDLAYKSAFGPLIDALKNLKNANDIKALASSPPKGVTKKDADDFTKFAQQIKTKIETLEKKKDVSVASILKEILKWSKGKSPPLPPYKKEYDPLVEALKKVKKTSQINGLSMGPPLGARPANVDKDVAAEFTSVFCKAVIDELKGGDKKKKVGMKAVRSVRAHITHSIITKQPTNTGTCTNT